ncbi:MAG: CRISPR-associated protein Cas4 [Bacteroidota bacterium]
MPTSSRIGGMLVGYYLVCPRKAWLSLRGLWMEQEHEAVALGRLLDRSSYRRRHRPGLFEADAPDGTGLVAKIDGVNLREGVLHETKKGRSCEEAHLWQVRFYLWVLKRCGVTGPSGRPLRGQLDYPALRRTEPVELQPEHEAHLEQLVATLADLAKAERPPARFPRRSFCRRCAFEDLCYG